MNLRTLGVPISFRNVSAKLIFHRTNRRADVFVDWSLMNIMVVLQGNIVS